MLLVLRLVGSEAQPTVVIRPRGGGVHCTPSPDESPFPSGSPNLGVQLQRKGSHDENLFVGASPVVDYFAFMLENLANSALHRVSGEPLRRCVLRPVDHASNEEQVVEKHPSGDDEIYIYIRVGMVEIDQSSFTSVLSVDR